MIGSLDAYPPFHKHCLQGQIRNYPSFLKKRVILEWQCVTQGLPEIISGEPISTRLPDFRQSITRNLFKKFIWKHLRYEGDDGRQHCDLRGFIGSADFIKWLAQTGAEATWYSAVPTMHMYIADHAEALSHSSGLPQKLKLELVRTKSHKEVPEQDVLAVFRGFAKGGFQRMFLDRKHRNESTKSGEKVQKPVYIHQNRRFTKRRFCFLSSVLLLLH